MLKKTLIYRKECRSPITEQKEGRGQITFLAARISPSPVYTDLTLEMQDLELADQRRVKKIPLLPKERKKKTTIKRKVKHA